MIDDESFINSLEIEDLKKKYIKLKEEKIKFIDEKFSNDFNSLKAKLEKEIQIDKNHRMILNACIFPFSQKNSFENYGYIFLRASPLSEIGEKNFDFLLFNKTNHVIIGEAKGQVKDPSRVIDEYKQRRSILEDNMDYFKNTYLNSGNCDSEFVLGVNWADSNETMKSILRKKLDIIVWSVGVDFITLKNRILKFVAPPSQPDKSHKKMLHVNRKLCSLETETSIDYKSFFPDSHIFAKLMLLIYLEEDENGNFRYDDLTELVKTELHYLGNDEIRKIVDEILKMGQEINFLDKVSSFAEPQYKIISKGKKADTREKELKNKWIKYQINKKKEQEIIQEISTLHERLLNERKKYKTMLDFTENNF